VPVILTGAVPLGKEGRTMACMSKKSAKGKTCTTGKAKAAKKK